MSLELPASAHFPERSLLVVQESELLAGNRDGHPVGDGRHVHDSDTRHVVKHDLLFQVLQILELVDTKFVLVLQTKENSVDKFFHGLQNAVSGNKAQKGLCDRFSRSELSQWSKNKKQPEIKQTNKTLICSNLFSENVLDLV